MRRREFITLLGGMVARPVTARAQQPSGIRRIGFLHDYAEIDPDGKAQVTAFRDALEKLGWSEGRNIVLDYKSGAVSSETLRNYATEMISHNPDVVLTGGATITAAVQRANGRRCCWARCSTGMPKIKSELDNGARVQAPCSPAPPV